MIATPAAAPKLATRLAFFAAGFAMASWAPLVPFAKARVGVDDATLGTLLLGMGLGSVAAMPLTGAASSRFGSRAAIVTGGLGAALALPGLAAAGSTAVLGAMLVLFGAALGTLNVAMNVNAVEVERLARRPLMSSFHAHFSIGAFAGSSATTALLASGSPPILCEAVCAVLVTAAVLAASPFLVARARGRDGRFFTWPRGTVFLLAGAAAITFLVEGAMRDWSALLIVGRGIAPAGRAGLGFIAFSITMTGGRLAGDRLAERMGDRSVLLLGSVAAAVGLLGLAFAGRPWLVLAACLATGLGASNIVPVLYRRVGATGDMPSGPAVAALTTVGHGAVILGPAGIGFAANALGLPFAFALLGLCMAIVPLIAGRAGRPPMA